MKEFFLKIIATSSRSLYALVCGLFISRWVVAVLVKSEFGLYGGVGGMMVIELLAGSHIPRGRWPSREIRLSRSDQVARRATRGALRSKVARGRAGAMRGAELLRWKMI